jgi:hypothetical protein
VPGVLVVVHGGGGAWGIGGIRYNRRVLDDGDDVRGRVRVVVVVVVVV